MNRKRVGILIFPAVGFLDFCGPFEVFSVTGLDEDRHPWTVPRLNEVPVTPVRSADCTSSAPA
jgi:hypothetical protein